MIWLNFGKWYSHSTSMFVWQRIYRHGYRWTPFIMARLRYDGKATNRHQMSMPEE